MMRRRVVIPALLLATMGAVPAVATAQYGGIKLPAADASSERFSAEQLDNLAGPVALYPDALLAQVLVAATFPEQMEDAASFVRSFGTDSVDNQPWDVSVKAVAHYPSALNALADKIDWTTALGKAYAIQSTDVMAAVQRLRKRAADQGNLNSTPQQNVVAQNDVYQIVPVEPRVLYVPVYDPYIIYSRPIFTTGFTSRFFSFGVGFPIGSWLIYDCDWGLRRVYYNGWSPSYYGYGGGWRQRSRPYIQVTNIYVNTRYNNVYVNRNVVTRNINYYNVDRYASVHNGRHFEGRRDGRYDRDDRSRYANRTDGENGSAVRGRGYTDGSPAGAANGRDANRDDRNAGTDNRRPGSTRDGSGYGNDRGPSNNTGANGGTRTARPRAPEVRRNEPVTPSESLPQVIHPERRGEPRNQDGGQPVNMPQRRAEPRGEDVQPSINQGVLIPPQRRAPAADEARDEPRTLPRVERQRQPRVEQPNAEPRGEPSRAPQPRAEQPRGESRAPQPSVRSEGSRGSDSGRPTVRTARPRGN